MSAIFDREMYKMKQYWLSTLSNRLQYSGLPVHLKRTNITGYTDKCLDFKVEDEQVEQINSLARESDFLKYVILMTALKICLFKYTKNELITVGSPILGGKGQEKEQSGIIPIVDHVTENFTFKDLLKNNRESLVGAYQNQKIPMEIVTSNLSDNDENIPLFDFIIALKEIHPVISNSSSCVTLIFNANNGGLSGSIKYIENMFSDEVINSFKNDYLDVLKTCLGSHELNIEHYPLCKLQEQKETKNTFVKTNDQWIDLQAIERALVKHPTVITAKIVIRTDLLVAYLVGSPNTIRSNQLLLSFLSNELPKYMIPQEFIWVEGPEIVLPDEEIVVSSTEKQEPQTVEERAIADVWCELLGLRSIGINEDFFEIGGDSILSMQAYFKLKQLGFPITPTDIISSPTIRELIRNMDKSTVVHTDQGVNSGEVKLSPSQYWFFEKNLRNPHHYNNAVAVKLRNKISPSIATEAINHLSRHHDAMRLRFKKEASQWRQYITELDSSEVLFIYNLDNIPEDSKLDRIEYLSDYHQRKLSITEKPVIVIILFSLGDNSPDYMVIIGHRLVTDGITLEIIIEDFISLCSQLESRINPTLPSKTTSIKYWAEELHQYAQSKEIDKRRAYWITEGLRRTPAELPVDFSDGDNYESSTRLVYKNLDKDRTDDLVHVVPRNLGVDLRDILYTALLKTMSQWTGEREILIESGGHGRELISDEIDLSRTAGWFTTNFPVFLRMPEKSDDVSCVLQEIRGQMSKITRNGFDYGLIRYLREPSCESHDLYDRTDFARPLIGFDYQGNFNLACEYDMDYTLVDIPIGVERDPSNARIYEFDISCWIDDGRYVLRWSYSKERYTTATIDMLMELYFQNLNKIIDISQELSTNSLNC